MRLAGVPLREGEGWAEIAAALSASGIAMLVYTHVVQLTLIDCPPDEAFLLAHRVAARAFDADFTRAGLEAARCAVETASETAPRPTATPPTAVRKE